METIASLWWLWLAGAVATLLYGGYNQVSRMRRMMDSAQQVENLFRKGWKSTEQSFFQGIVPLFLAAILHLGFVVLLVTSIVLNVIDYAKR